RCKMSRKRKLKRPAKPTPKVAPRKSGASNHPDARFQERYERACRLAEEGRHREARRRFEDLGPAAPDARGRAVVRNDAAALAVLTGALEAGRQGFQAALALDPQCEPARANLALLEPKEATEEAAGEAVERQEVLVPAQPVEAVGSTKVA